jgi:hypothetical protein
LTHLSITKRQMSDLLLHLYLYRIKRILVYRISPNNN